MEIYNNFQNISFLKKEKNINFKNKTVPIQQITNKGLKIASGAIASLGIASIAINNKQTDNNVNHNGISIEDILYDLKQKLPEETFNKVLEKNDVNYLQKLYYLSEIKGLCRDGKEISIIPNYKLPELVNNDINLDDTIELAQMRYEDENGVSKIRWNGSEIIELLKSNINIKSDEFKKLSSFMHKYANLATTGYYYGDENNYYSGVGHLAPRFNYCDIIKFLESNIDINSQRFNDLIAAEILDSTGKPYPLFNCFDIITYVKSDANIDNLVKIEQLTYCDTKGNKWPLFHNYKDEIELSKRNNLDYFISLTNQQIKDDDTGISRSRFAQYEIRNLIKSNIDFSLINEFANMPLKDEYNRKINQPSMDILIKKAKDFEVKDKDIKEGIKNIDDIKLRSILEKQYNNLSIRQKLEQQDLFTSKIDAYNNLTGKYLTFKYIVDQDNPQWHRFIKYCQNNNIELKDEGKTENLYFDFIEQQRVESFIELCNDSKELNITRDEALDYMYEEIYLKKSHFPAQLSDTSKNMLIKVNRDFGTKVILPSCGEYIYYIEYIKKELEEWNNASSGQAKYPPVIDLLKSKVNYIDNTSAYGISRSSGFCRPNGSKYIAIDGYQNIEGTLRHELMHANDQKLLSTFPRYCHINTYGKKEELYGEFKAGKPNISRSHFEYAFNNPKEFIAVAAEGDMSKYSQWFIDQLIELGMPNWVINLRQH